MDSSVEALMKGVSFIKDHNMHMIHKRGEKNNLETNQRELFEEK